MSRTVRIIIAVCLFAAGFIALIYPEISSRLNDISNKEEQTAYTEAVDSLEKERTDAIWQAAEAYNAQHTVNTLKDAFTNSETYTPSDEYESLLNPYNDGIMGYLSIPKIDIELPIWHGIGQEELQKGCGHVEGTSLPVGGKGTHAGIAAHRGLPGARLFTDLDLLEEGDTFQIKVLDRTLTYEVDKISVVKPEDVDELAIDPQKDYVTLITCTPFGVNTERLLVRGVRAEDDTAGSSSAIGAHLRQAAIVILAAALVVIFIRKVWKNRKQIPS